MKKINSIMVKPVHMLILLLPFIITLFSAVAHDKWGISSAVPTISVWEKKTYTPIHSLDKIFTKHKQLKTQWTTFVFRIYLDRIWEFLMKVSEDYKW